MKLIADLALDNASFEGRQGPAEVARILRTLADELEARVELAAGSEIYQMRDVNGNRVGIAYITDL